MNAFILILLITSFSNQLPAQSQNDDLGRFVLLIRPGHNDLTMWVKIFVKETSQFQYVFSECDTNNACKILNNRPIELRRVDRLLNNNIPLNMYDFPPLLSFTDWSDQLFVTRRFIRFKGLEFLEVIKNENLQPIIFYDNSFHNLFAEQLVYYMKYQ